MHDDTLDGFGEAGGLPAMAGLGSNASIHFARTPRPSPSHGNIPGGREHSRQTKKKHRDHSQVLDFLSAFVKRQGVVG
ncbi:hypothetical protein [Achromobacter insuavis]|uniref:hypothetical protein n=1 Tax=Achromobacter insuavis TaxID=1287735 RepID=UPI001F136145|nr:hypothetical protein [Achromobacter insuavis]